MNTKNGQHGDLSSELDAAERWRTSCEQARAAGLKPAELPPHVQSWDEAVEHYQQQGQTLKGSSPS